MLLPGQLLACELHKSGNKTVAWLRLVRRVYFHVRRRRQFRFLCRRPIRRPDRKFSCILTSRRTGSSSFHPVHVFRSVHALIRVVHKAAAKEVVVVPNSHIDGVRLRFVCSSDSHVKASGLLSAQPHMDISSLSILTIILLLYLLDRKIAICVCL